MSSGVQKDIDKLREGFKDIDKSILDGAKEFRTLQESISKTNSLLASKNWIIFSRFISGTPLWRIQNRIKATVMLLNEIGMASEKRRTEEAKELKNFSKLAKLARDNESVQESLNELKELSTKTDKKSVEQYKKQMAALRETSEIFDGLVFKLHEENDAITEMTKTIKSQVDMGKRLQEQAKETASLRKKEGEGEIAHLGRMMKFNIMNNNITKSFSKFKDKVDKEGFAFTNKRYQTELQITKAMTKRAGKLGVDAEGLMDKTGKLTGPRETLGKDKKLHRFDAKGKKISSRQFDKLNELAKMSKKQNGIRAKSYKMMKRPFAAMGSFFKKVLINIVKMTFYAAAQFAKFLLLVLVTLAAFKMIQPFLGNIQHALETALTVLLDGFALIWSGLSNIVGGVGMLFDLFTDFSWGALAEALYTILLGFGEVFVGLLQVVFGTIFAAVGSFIADTFRDGFEKVGGGIRGIASGIVNVVKGVAGVVAGIALVIGTIGLLVGAAFALPVLIVAGIATLIYMVVTRFEGFFVDLLTAIGEGLSWLKEAIISLPKGIGDAIKDIGGGVKKLGKNIGGGIKDFVGLSTGGKISQSGMAIVGEKGPELVTLPRGAQVHSNSQSKAMASSVTNHITVQVTGRVGANDTEIRDIANKVAKEINSRMNRTSTSVVKF